MSHKCDSCDSVTINGVYCHELGCPRYNEELRAKELEEVEEVDQKNPVLVARQQELASCHIVSKVYDGSQTIDFDDEDLILSISLVGEFNGCDLVHIANMNSLQEEFGSFIVNSCGEIDNDTLAQMSDSVWEKFLSTVEALCDYPVVDESELSRLEHEIHLERIAELAKEIESDLFWQDITVDSDKLEKLVQDLYFEWYGECKIYLEHDYAIINDEVQFKTEVSEKYLHN